MIEWTEKYNCFSAQIARGAISLSVVWNSTRPKGSAHGYVVTVNNRKLKLLAKDVATGKAAAVRLARKILEEAAIALEGETG